MGEKLVPHQDPSGQVKQPRWVKCWGMWQELTQAINQSQGLGSNGIINRFKCNDPQ
jgi:hypothetical protein